MPLLGSEKKKFFACDSKIKSAKSFVSLISNIVSFIVSYIPALVVLLFFLVFFLISLAQYDGAVLAVGKKKKSIPLLTRRER